MTDETVTAPTLCPECREKLRPDHFYAYCPHNECLAVADQDAAGVTVGFVTYGTLSESEARAAMVAGIEDAVTRFEGITRH